VINDENLPIKKGAQSKKESTFNLGLSAPLFFWLFSYIEYRIKNAYFIIWFERQGELENMNANKGI